MTVDQELQNHRDTWNDFTRLMRWVVALVVVILAGLALFVA
jgi:hypothetical protein